MRKQLDAQGTCGINGTQVHQQILGLPGYFLRHWAPRSVSFAQAQRTYNGLAGWGRTRFQVVGGKLYYPDLKHNTFGCVLRRTPILAWALLEMLERYPHTPDVDLPVNCRDKPGSQLRRPGAASELAFSYTTGRAFSDVPLPDYTYWGLPYADLPPWSDWLSRPMAAWEEKLDQMIWVGSPTNPLRQAFRRCASDHFGERLVHRMPDKEQMHELAWRCKPSASGKGCPLKPKQWTPLEEQCRYKYILHLPGISDWLEHFKHQLACGSVNIFIGSRPPAGAARPPTHLRPLRLLRPAAQGGPAFPLRPRRWRGRRRGRVQAAGGGHGAARRGAGARQVHRTQRPRAEPGDGHGARVRLHGLDLERGVRQAAGGRRAQGDTRGELPPGDEAELLLLCAAGEAPLDGEHLRTRSPRPVQQHAAAASSRGRDELWTVPLNPAARRWDRSYVPALLWVALGALASAELCAVKGVFKE